ncbi:MAG: hypothetical protein KDD66_02685 [Bdellovibrionales bacterium]|nr:hypothetical protein [Bdellovibrionales bacterium]
MNDRNGAEPGQFTFSLDTTDTAVLLTSLRALSGYQQMGLEAQRIAETFGASGTVHVTHVGLPFGRETVDSFEGGEFDDTLLGLIGHESIDVAVTAARLLANRDTGYRLMVAALLEDDVDEASEEDSLPDLLVKLATGELEIDDPQQMSIRLLMAGGLSCVNEVFTALRKKLRPEASAEDADAPATAEVETGERETATAS